MKNLIQNVVLATFTITTMIGVFSGPMATIGYAQECVPGPYGQNCIDIDIDIDNENNNENNNDIVIDNNSNSQSSSTSTSTSTNTNTNTSTSTNTNTSTNTQYNTQYNTNVVYRDTRSSIVAGAWTETYDPVVIDKKIGKPDSDDQSYEDVTYVDNFTSADTTFAPGDYVYFRIVVKNVTSDTIERFNIHDLVPPYLEPVEWPSKGGYNGSTRIIRWTIEDFAPGEEETYYLKMRVMDADQLPEYNLILQINKAQTDRDSAYDTSQLYIKQSDIKDGTDTSASTNTFAGLEQFPATGVEMQLLIGATLLWLGHRGYMLTRVQHRQVK